MDDQVLEKVKIRGVLEFVSEIQVGNGEPYDLEAEQKAVLSREQLMSNTFCLNEAGLPYIPGTTLRGAFRQRFREMHAGSESAFDSIFGFTGRSLTKSSGDASLSRAGSLRAYDSPLSGSVEFRKEMRNSIEPVTRTAADHKLFADIKLKAGSRFELDLELDRILCADMNQLLECLLSFRGYTGDQLGAGKSLDFGKFKIDEKSLSCKVLTQSALKNWLAEEGDESLDRLFETVTLDRDGSADFEPGYFPLSIGLTPLTPLLIVDHEFKSSPSPDGRSNLVRCKVNDNRIEIASSTFRGIFRHQARRIVMTKLGIDFSQEQSVHQSVADQIVGKLFGNHERASLIRFSVFSGLLPENHEFHHQHFVAIDRFSGGVGDGKLFEAQAARPQILEGAMHISRDLASKDQYLWAKALLALTIRDFLFDGLSVGWGTNRGFGALALSAGIDKNSRTTQWGKLSGSWTSLFKETDSLEQALVALDEVIANQVNSATVAA